MADAVIEELESQLRTYKVGQLGQGCPFCHAESTLQLPFRTPKSKMSIVLPERCLRCGAEWDLIFDLRGVVLTEQGRPMDPRPVKKKSAPLSFPKKSKLFTRPEPKDEPEDDKDKPMKPLPPTVADGSGGMRRGE